MSKTPDAVTFTGARLPDGRPVRYLAGIPSRDLSAADLAKLSAEQVKSALESGLYAAVKPPKPEPAKIEKKEGDA